MKTTATTKEAYKLFHEGTQALSQVEHNGIRVDMRYLKSIIKKTEERIVSKEKQLRNSDVYKVWKKHFGSSMNINSGDQLGVILFDVMGYDCSNTTATGKYKTDIATLEKLDIPYVKKHLYIKKLKKACNTYLKGIQKEAVDGFLHPNFDLNIAATFRGNSNNPNFQNMPIRNPEIGMLVRRAFIPRIGHTLIEKDYSGIEVRIATCYHKDPTMIRYINDPSKDMHRDMAQECFIIDSVKHVSKTSRYCGKNQFVFPQFYGDWYLDCAKALWDSCTSMNLEVNGVPMIKHLRSKGIKGRGACKMSERPLPNTFEDHIRKVEKRFWDDRFRVYSKWKKSWFEQYSRKGYFDTLTGFRISGIMKRNEVINYPVQGPAFHCLLWSIINSLKELKRNNFSALLVGQIHDSIIGDCPNGEVQDYLHLMREVMTTKLLQTWKWINVPLEIEAELSTKSWYDKKEWVEQNGVWVLPKK